MDCSPPGFLLRGVLQARALQWVAMSSSSQDLPDPGIEPAPLSSPAWAGMFFTIRATWKAATGWQLPWTQAIYLYKDQSLSRCGC